MQICKECLQELVNSDTECFKCKSKNILTFDEYDTCRKFFMYHPKNIVVYKDEPYYTYLKYLKKKEERERTEYLRLHPPYASYQSNSFNSVKESNKYVPKCPTCGSPDVEKISLTSKVVGGALFGLFSSNVRKTMHCRNCGYKW